MAPKGEERLHSNGHRLQETNKKIGPEIHKHTL